MLNNIILMGRLVKAPETRFLQGSNNSVTRFTIAIDRDYRADIGNSPQADFINCVAWNGIGEFVSKYFDKGSLIAIVGRVETGSYTDKDGKKVYTFEVNVNKASFTGEKRGDRTEPTPKPDDFMSIPEGLEEGIPFN